MIKHLVLLATFVIVGCADNNVTIDLEGRVATKGSAPHSYLSIQDKKTSKIYKISNAKELDLVKNQNQQIKLKAKLLKEAIGPGFPAVIKVIEVD